MAKIPKFDYLALKNVFFGPLRGIFDHKHDVLNKINHQLSYSSSDWASWQQWKLAGNWPSCLMTMGFWFHCRGRMVVHVCQWGHELWIFLVIAVALALTLGIMQFRHGHRVTLQSWKWWNVRIHIVLNLQLQQSFCNVIWYIYFCAPQAIFFWKSTIWSRKTLWNLQRKLHFFNENHKEITLLRHKYQKNRLRRSHPK